MTGLVRSASLSEETPSRAAKQQPQAAQESAVRPELLHHKEARAYHRRLKPHQTEHSGSCHECCMQQDTHLHSKPCTNKDHIAERIPRPSEGTAQCHEL